MMDTTPLVGSADRAGGIRPDVIEGYYLERQIGSGATSSVYLAHETGRSGAKVAVKILAPYLALRDEMKRRWQREGELLSRLKHPHIVRGLTFGTMDGRPFLVMEYLQGETLNDRVRRLGKLPPEEVFGIARAALGALNAAHDIGLVHRDIKPANIIRLNDGTIKLMDFGLAKLADDPGITQTGMMVGTPMYMAPEQARGEEVTTQCDLYSLGATLFHLASGRPPFTEVNTSLLLTRKITDETPDVRTADPEIPSGLAYLINRLTARFRDKRPKTPAAALVILDKVETGELSETGPVASPRVSKSAQKPSAVLEAIPRDNRVLETLVGDKELDVRPRLLERDEVLFYEDATSRECYVLLSGKVEVIKAGRTVTTIDKPGSFIGEMSPLQGVPRSATVVARDETVLLIVEEKDFLAFFTRHTEMALALAKSLSERLRETTQKLDKANARVASLARHVREMHAEVSGV